MLSIDDIIQLEQQAAQELDLLQADLASSGDEVAAIPPDKAIGRLSRLDAMQMQQVAKAAQRRREDRITALQNALDRIDAGRYGQCELCHNWIALDRLQAQPEAIRCGDCAG
ncbi:MAG: TraR/DksA C4-type zinc finger protein [Verrucomicrobiota bacterium]